MAVPEHQRFEVKITKSMMKPHYQFTLPSRVAQGLQLNPQEPTIMWFTTSPRRNYQMEFKRQSHPQGGWRATKDANWGELMKAYQLPKGEKLVFEKMGFPSTGCFYVLCSPVLDAWNVMQGNNPEALFDPPTDSEEDGTSSDDYEIECLGEGRGI